MKNPFWTAAVPLWVSRKNADGVISHFTVPGWLFMAVAVLVVLNVLAWGAIGLVEAVKWVIT